jgi:4-hydroxy-3-polyprenylbenzoate decarboxylase
MGYRNLQQCVRDLEATGRLVRIDDPVDACLEAAEIQRRVFAAGGPAVLFANVTGCRFPMVSNLFGTIERARFLFRDTLEAVRRLIELKIEPQQLMRRPWRYVTSPRYALAMLPRGCRRGPVLECETVVSQLPQLKSWPDDGGAFVTLPQVYTEHVESPGMMKSNLGMYRIQLSGGQYQPDREIGLHYQLHRSIGVHHAAAVRSGQPLRLNIFVGGTPAMTLAAVMPLPEGMSELTFAGALAGHRIPMITGQRAKMRRGNPVDLLPIYAEADFCISGTVDLQRQLPEGPFGDHLGYYSLAHDFPVLNVHRVCHRRDAIWPFTVVGRPPQEDTIFGELIHELTGPIIPTVIPGVRAVHAVDAAGVHPLLLAVGSERYTPYNPLRCPQELLTQANAILGQGQLSLAKYLLIVAEQATPSGHPRHRRLLCALVAASGLDARPAFSDSDHHRHVGLHGQRHQRGLETGHRRCRSVGPRVADGVARADRAARRFRPAATVPAGRVGGTWAGLYEPAAGDRSGHRTFLPPFPGRSRNQSVPVDRHRR